MASCARVRRAIRLIKPCQCAVAKNCFSSGPAVREPDAPLAATTGGGGAPWALPLIPIKAITIQGSYVGNLRETQELLDLVRNRKIPPIPVLPMPLSKANEALTDLQKGKLVGRAVLRPCALQPLHVIAMSEATKQTILSVPLHGLLRCARNDDNKIRNPHVR